MSNVILPAANRAELADLPDDVRRGLVFHEVHHMDEALSLALLPPLKAPIEGLPFQAEGDAWHERRAAQ